MKAVADASVLIDMHWAEAWNGFFRLRYLWMTPDMVAKEVRSFSMQNLVKRYGFRIETLSGQQMAEVAAMADLYRGPGSTDLAALCLAKHEGACLATCDGKLREAAEAEGVLCFGSLKLLEDMVDHQLLLPIMAIRGLATMLANGSRLPETECLRLLRKWAGLSPDG